MINEDSGFYSLKRVGEIGIHIPFKRESVDLMSLQFQKIKEQLGTGTEFTARYAREKCDISRTTFQRLVNWAVENRKLEKQGLKNDTKYLIPTESEKFKLQLIQGGKSDAVEILADEKKSA